MPDVGQHEGGFFPSRQAHVDEACEEEEQKVGMGEEEGENYLVGTERPMIITGQRHITEVAVGFRSSREGRSLGIFQKSCSRDSSVQCLVPDTQKCTL